MSRPKIGKKLMPLVERDAECTIVVLVYRSLRWLDWCMEGVERAQNKTRYRWLVVSNDGTDEVRNDPRVDIDWENKDTAGKKYPDPEVMKGIYAAWTEGVLNSPTQWCILMNTDMYMSDYAIDELVALKRSAPKSLPCSLLVESGRIPSAMPERVRNFGRNPHEFDAEAFTKHAASIRNRAAYEPGRLFQPVLFDRQEFFDLGGYPAGNVGGVSGDKILFNRYVAAGYDWVTCLGSVVAHIQTGETEWP